ncbi:MAG: HAD family hydrolase [Chthoniobacterales bacterium]
MTVDSPLTSDRFSLSEFPDGEFGAYIFDCDGTLADSMPLHYSSWKAAMASHGVDFPKALFYSWGGKKGHEIVSHLNALLGTSMDVNETVKKKQLNYLDAVHGIQPIEIVLAIARQSRGKIPMAVASGGQRRLVEGTLAAIGVLDWFDAVVCAEDYARGKPEPDPFLETARRLGVAPEKCLVFEDTETGIQAATAAGMKYVLVSDRSATR